MGPQQGGIDYALLEISLLHLSQGILSYANGWGGMINVFIIGLIDIPIYLIKKFDLSTPSRNGNMVGITSNKDCNSKQKAKNSKSLEDDKWFKMTVNTIKIVEKNIIEVVNCITRIRMVVKDN